MGQERWRAGRKTGRTLYLQVGDDPSDDDVLIGMMDTPELAAQVVAAVNSPNFRWVASAEGTYGTAPVRVVRRDGPEHLGWRS